jgi:PIN domain nuclease of toxin-antitoxin system
MARGADRLYLDTHVLIWLRRGELRRFPATVRRRLDYEPELRISPMVLVELDVLHEIGSLTESSTTLVGGLDLGIKVCDLPFPAVAAAAAHLAWTRDPFDRLIVAQAVVAQAPLVTRDRTIHRHSAVAYWGD